MICYEYPVQVYPRRTSFFATIYNNDNNVTAPLKLKYKKKKEKREEKESYTDTHTCMPTI
jgi:hypothetical protein